MIDSISHIETFFSKIRSFEADYWVNELAEERKQWTSFLGREKLFQEEIKEIRKKETPYYNVFEVLNIHHRETKTHTPFLVHLLNPKASHEQEALFLDAFFKNVLNTDFQYEEITEFKIHEEFSFGDGRIDIYIKFRHNEHEYGIVIENKIYGGDRPNQLGRYYDYIKKERGLHIDNILVVYLTVEKKKAGDLTMCHLLAERLYKQGVLIDISYKEDLINWLEECQRNCTSEMIKYTLKQYQQTITYL